MGTYSIEKIKADWEKGTMSPEQAIGHTIQHIEIMQKQQTKATADQQKTNNQVAQILEELQKMRVDNNHWHQEQMKNTSRLDNLERKFQKGETPKPRAKKKVLIK